MSLFQKAEKVAKPAKVALSGAAGSGKTLSALKLTKGFGGKTALCDTENYSSVLYAEEYEFDVVRVEPPFTPDKFATVIKAAESEGYSNLIIDSFSHPWAGDGGLLDIKGAIEDSTGNGWAAWRRVTPRHNALVSCVLQSPLNIIVTLRAKMEYAQEKDDKTGKSKVVKLGMMPIQREGVDYEFDLVFDLDANHYGRASKVRSTAFDEFYQVLDEKVGKKIIQWVQKGVKSDAPTPFEISTPSPTSEPQKAATRQPQAQQDPAPAQPQPPKQPTNGKHPNQAQLKRMFAIAKEAALSNASLKELIKNRFGFESSKDLLIEHYNELCGDGNGDPGLISYVGQSKIMMTDIKPYPEKLPEPLPF